LDHLAASIHDTVPSLDRRFPVPSVPPLDEALVVELREQCSTRDAAHLYAAARICFELDDRHCDVLQRVKQVATPSPIEREMAARLARRVVRMLPREGEVTPLEVCLAPPRWLVAEVETFGGRVTDLRTPLPQVELHGLGSIHYEHSDDRMALDALRAIPGFDRVVAKTIDKFVKKHEMELLMNAIEVVPRAMPELHRALVHACAVLQVEPPRMYIEGSPVLNAYTSGVDRPIIVLTQPLIDVLTFEELVFVIGHELGHIKSGHVLYYTMARKAGDFAASAAANIMGVGEAVIKLTILPALQFWSRRSEYTADRAGLLACQNPNIAVTALAKLAGLPGQHATDFEAGDLIAQALRLTRMLDSDQIHRVLVALDQVTDSHPRNIWRVATLMHWIDSGEYEDLVRATEGERRYFGERVGNDPMIVVFLDEAVHAMVNWAQPASERERRLLVRAARQMLRLGRNADTPPLSNVFNVQLQVRRVNDQCLVYTHLLAVQDGLPVAIDLPSSAPQGWSRLPRDVRKHLLQSGGSESTYEVYRKRSTP